MAEVILFTNHLPSGGDPPSIPPKKNERMDAQNDAIILKGDTCSKAIIGVVTINPLHRIRMLQSLPSSFSCIGPADGFQNETTSSAMRIQGTSPKPGLPSFLETFLLAIFSWESSRGPTSSPKCHTPPEWDVFHQKKYKSKMIHSRELTYPPKMAFWRWFSELPKVGYVNPLEGNWLGGLLFPVGLYIRGSGWPAQGLWLRMPWSCCSRNPGATGRLRGFRLFHYELVLKDFFGGWVHGKKGWKLRKCDHYPSTWSLITFILGRHYFETFHSKESYIVTIW